MSLPEGVTTCTVTAGVPVTHTGAPVKAFVSIEPSVFLVHTATGTPLVDFLEELSINEGVAGQFTLPHTDQAGFQDENGNAYTNWYYTARISYSTPSKAKTKAPKIKVFQLATGQTIVDLDALPGGAPALPYTAPIATVTAFGGRTGPVELLDEDLPERLSDTALSATYATAATVATLTAGKLDAAAVASFSTLKAGLAEGNRSTAVQILGDSTGNETSEWVYKFANAMRTDYPAWTVHYKLWDDAAQNFGATTVLQTGTAGARSLGNAVGTTPRRLDPTVSTNITGTIDARVKLSMSDWTPGAQVNLGGRSGGAGFRGWYMFLNTAGVPGFVYSVDGTALVTMFGTATAGIADGATTWLRYLFTPDDGAGNRVAKFYKSTDNVTWTQIGATVTTVGAVTVHQPVWGYELGGNAGGVISPATTTVNIFEVEFRNGENGPNVVPALPDLWPPYDLNAIRVSGAPVLTFVNGSKAGGDSAYLGDPVRLPKLTPAYGQSVTLISNSHNEGLAVDKVWLDKYETFRQAVEARLPGASTVILTQNPETSGTTWYREHRARRLNLLGYARAKGVDIIDTYRAFLNYGAAWETDLMQDAVHPNTAGSDLWAATVEAAFDASA